MMKRNMRNLIALLLAGIMLVGMTACMESERAQGNEHPSGITSMEEGSDDSVKTTALENEDSPDSTEALQGTEVPDMTVPPIIDVPTMDNNIFLNNDNNYHDVNAVSIRPRYVYWEDGKLVAECFVINGFDHIVSNINVKNLALGNDSGLIAEGSFGMLEGLVLAPYTYHIWTFTFVGDAVEAYGANLSSLQCRFSTQYIH